MCSTRKITYGNMGINIIERVVAVQKRVTLSLLGFLITVMMITGVFVTGAFAMDNHSGNDAGNVNHSHSQTGQNSGNMGPSGSNAGNEMGTMPGMNMNGMNMNGPNSNGGAANSSGGNETSSDEANTPPNWPFIYTIGAINIIAIIAAALMKKSALKGNGVN